MKQMIFLIVVMAVCTFKSFVNPFWATLLYYFFAVFRPQAIWEWSLPPGVRWSQYAAVLAVIALIIRWGSIGERAVERLFPLLFALFGLCILASYCGAINGEVAGAAGWEYAKILIMPAGRQLCGDRAATCSISRVGYSSVADVSHLSGEFYLRI